MRLCPELITTPSRTTTQPTGTSPFCKACGVTEISKAFSNHYNEKIIILITFLPSSRAMSMNFSSSSFCSISLFFTCWSSLKIKSCRESNQSPQLGRELLLKGAPADHPPMVLDLWTNDKEKGRDLRGLHRLNGIIISKITRI